MFQVLLVESDKAIRRAFLTMVQQSGLGYEVVTAATMVDAAVRLREMSFDVVLLSIEQMDSEVRYLLDGFSDTTPFILALPPAWGAAARALVLRAGGQEAVRRDDTGDYLRQMPLTIAQAVLSFRLKLRKPEREAIVQARNEVSRAALLGQPMKAALDSMFADVARVVPFDYAWVMAVEDDQLRAVYDYQMPERVRAQVGRWRGKLVLNNMFNEIVQQGEAHTQDDLTLRKDSRTTELIQLDGAFLGMPLITPDDQVGGVVLFCRAEQGSFRQLVVRQLWAAAELVGAIINESKAYKHTIETALIEERQRLARDLHDSVTQTLFAASMMSEALIKQWPPTMDDLERSLHDLHDLTRDALSEMRALLLDLRPDSMMIGSLAAQIEQLAVRAQERGHFEVKITNHGSYQPPTEVKNALFRITQEALNNIVKHARAKLVRVSLSRQPHLTELEVWDDGVGFDSRDGSAQTHLGLAFMRERAEENGIILHVESVPNYGTRIRATWMP